MAGPTNPQKATPQRPTVTWPGIALPALKIIAGTIIIILFLWAIGKPYIEKLIDLSTLDDLKGYGTYLGVIGGSWLVGYRWPNISFFPRG